MANDDSWSEEVKENFQEKVDETVYGLRQLAQEFLEFGEALDNAPDN